MFPSMQLGGEKEALEQAQVGAIQIARVSVGPVGTDRRRVSTCSTCRFVFRDRQGHMRAVIDGPIGDEMLKQIGDNPRTAAWSGSPGWDGGARSFYNKVRDIRSRASSDLKGLKIRMMGNPIFVDTMNALGGNGVAMGMDQVMNALQTGVVDGAENNPPSYDSFGHVPVAKHYTLTEHLIIPELLVFSRKSFDAMSKEDQALVLKFGKETQLEQRKLWDERVVGGFDEKDQGCRHRSHYHRRQEAVPGRGQAGLGQIWREIFSARESIQDVK